MAFDDLMTALNQTCIKTFAGNNPCTYIPAATPGNTFQIYAISSDPIRKENNAPGNFAIRYVQLADLQAAGVNPASGDVLVLEDGATKYKIDTPQADSGGMLRFVMLRKAV